MQKCTTNKWNIGGGGGREWLSANWEQMTKKKKKAWRIEAIMQDVLGTLKSKMALQPNTLKEAKEGGGVEGINH